MSQLHQDSSRKSVTQNETNNTYSIKQQLPERKMLHVAACLNTFLQLIALAMLILLSLLMPLSMLMTECMPRESSTTGGAFIITEHEEEQILSY